jgi:histidine triad (HIT) family protein
VHEDDKSIALLDINPINPGHLLVIPKGHYKTITDMPVELCRHLAGVVWRMSYNLQEALDPDGIRVLQNNNEAAGQEVPHYHIHVIPRYLGDEANKRTKPSKAELVKLQEKLKKIGQQKI